MPDKEQFADVEFPQRGLNLTQAFGSALPLTTPIGQNVRWNDPLENRGRGASRPGLVKYPPPQVPAGAHLIQHLNFIVDPQAEATPDYDPPGGVTGGPNPFGGGPLGDGVYPDPTESTRNPTGRLVRRGGTGIPPTRGRVNNLIQFVQQTTTVIAVPLWAGSVSMLLGQPTPKNRLIIVAVSACDNSTLVTSTLPCTVSVSDNQGNAYTQVGPYVQAVEGNNGVFFTSNLSMSLWWAIAGTANTITATVTGINSNYFFATTILEYKNNNVIAPADAFQWFSLSAPFSNPGGDPAVTSGAVAGNFSNELLLGFITLSPRGGQGGYGGIVSYGAGFIPRVTSASSFLLELNPCTGGGTVTATQDSSIGTVGYGCLGVTLRHT